LQEQADTPDADVPGLLNRYGLAGRQLDRLRRPFDGS